MASIQMALNVDHFASTVAWEKAREYDRIESFAQNMQERLKEITTNDH